MEVLQIIKDWQPSWTMVVLWIYFDRRHRRTEQALINHEHDEETGKPIPSGNPDLLKEKILGD